MKKRKFFLHAPSFKRRTAGIYSYHPIQDSEDINLEPLTIRRIMKQVQVELLKPLEFCGHFGKKTYARGVHSLDSDLAKLLVRIKSARYILPHKEVLASKPSSQ